jgi:hypothetical protein
MPDFAIVPLPSGKQGSALKADAVATGGMSALFQDIHDAANLKEIIQRADAAVRAEQEIQARHLEERDQVIQALCDGITSMTRRLDQYQTRLALQRELDAQSRLIMDTYSIPDDLAHELERDHPTPIPGLTADPATGSLPAPSLTPDPRSADATIPATSRCPWLPQPQTQ